MPNQPTMNSNQERMVKELADAAMLRFHSCMQEGMSEHEAFQEIIATVLKCYREAMAT